MAKKMRDEAKERQWRKTFGRFAASGLGARAFCRRENLAESAFYFWRRELARRDQEDSTRRELRPSAQSPGFLPVRVTGSLRRLPAIVLELAGGRRLRLPHDIAATRLAEIVRALDAETRR